MKTLTTHVLIAVAALAVAASGASAQTYKASIPMSFHVGDKAMPAGSYELRDVSIDGQRVFTVRNVATGRSAVVAAAPGNDAPKAWRQGGSPVVAFDCLGDNCALTRLWDGERVSTYRFPGLKLHPAEAERIASITVTLTKAD